MIPVTITLFVCLTTVAVTKLILDAQTKTRAATNTQDFDLLKQEVQALSRAFNLGKLK